MSDCMHQEMIENEDSFCVKCDLPASVIVTSQRAEIFELYRALEQKDILLSMMRDDVENLNVILDRLRAELEFLKQTNN
jgi:hypothetical protein